MLKAHARAVRLVADSDQRSDELFAGERSPVPGLVPAGLVLIVATLLLLLIL